MSGPAWGFRQFTKFVWALHQFEREARRGELWEALQSRALTESELREVAEWGEDLNIQPDSVFNRDNKARELDTAKRMQVAFQLAKANAGKSQ